MLDFEGVPIRDNDTVIELSESLTNNNKLKELGIAYPEENITEPGLAAFSKLICNTTSINDIYYTLLLTVSINKHNLACLNHLINGSLLFF